MRLGVTVATVNGDRLYTYVGFALQGPPEWGLGDNGG